MKQTSPHACLSLALLRYVRDQAPTEADFLAWLGASDVGAYYVLRKAGLLRDIEGRIVLSPDHCGPGGQSFRYGNQLFLIDEDRVLTF